MTAELGNIVNATRIETIFTEVLDTQNVKAALQMLDRDFTRYKNNRFGKHALLEICEHFGVSRDEVEEVNQRIPAHRPREVVRTAVGLPKDETPAKKVEHSGIGYSWQKDQSRQAVISCTMDHLGSDLTAAWNLGGLPGNTEFAVEDGPAPTLLKIFPNSRYYGVDRNADLIKETQRHAEAQGLGNRVTLFKGDCYKLAKAPVALPTVFHVFNNDGCSGMIQSVCDGIVTHATSMMMAGKSVYAFTAQENERSPGSHKVKPKEIGDWIAQQFTDAGYSVNKARDGLYLSGKNNAWRMRQVVLYLG